MICDDTPPMYHVPTQSPNHPPIGRVIITNHKSSGDTPTHDLFDILLFDMYKPMYPPNH